MAGGSFDDAISRDILSLEELVSSIAEVSPSFPGAAEVTSSLDLLAWDAPNDLDGLLTHVFGTLRFQGNRRHYYAASNSLIHRVIERRKGNPLSLSVVAELIAGRVGCRLQIIGMPGHVLLADEANQTWFDPFNGGGLLDLDGCADIYERLFPGEQFDPGSLRPMYPLDVAARTLQNLRVAFLRSGDVSSLVDVLRLRVKLPRPDHQDRLDLANVLGALGRFEEAAEQHEILTRLRPADADRHQQAARRQRARSN